MSTKGEAKWSEKFWSDKKESSFVDQLGHAIIGQMKGFNETIRDTREARGLLLRQVAAVLDVDPSFLSRVEKGEKRPTREQVVKLAKVLGLDEEELLVLYLSERVLYELRDEDLAIKAILAAEKMARYRVRGKTKKLPGRSN